MVWGVFEMLMVGVEFKGSEDEQDLLEGGNECREDDGRRKWLGHHVFQEPSLSASVKKVFLDAIPCISTWVVKFMSVHTLCLSPLSIPASNDAL
jgi:hypothetical protein